MNEPDRPDRDFVVPTVPPRGAIAEEADGLSDAEAVPLPPQGPPIDDGETIPPSGEPPSMPARGFPRAETETRTYVFGDISRSARKAF